MKTLKILMVVAIALTVLAACSDEKEESEASTAVNGKWSLTTDSGLFTADDDGGSILFPASGGEVTFDVECWDSWTVQEDGADWLYLSVSLSAGMLGVTAQQSTLETEQTATLRLVTAGEGTLFATIDVVQSAYDHPELTLDSYEWNAPAVGALTTVIPVHSTDGWSASVDADCDWLTAEATDEGLALTAEANEAYEGRTTVVTVTGTDGVTSDSRTVTVIQDPTVYLEVNPEELFFDYTENTYTVTVETNLDWTYSTDGSWLTLSGEGDTLSVTATENSSSDVRGATITIIAGDGAENTTEGTVTVSQGAFGNAAMILEFTISNNGDTVKYPICGDVDCTIDWGDGVVEEHTDSLPSHTYASAGVYNASVIGTATRLSTQTITTDGKYPATVAHITDVVQWGNIGLTNMYEGLMDTKIKSLPADTQKAFADVTVMQYAFQDCTELTQIDPDLFAYSTSTKKMNYIFSGCSSLETVPGKLFANTPNCTQPNYIFRNCTSLKELPEDLFEGCESKTSIAYCFQGCSALTTLPEGLFSPLTSCTNFGRLFYQCSELEEIPAKLFSNNSAVTTIMYMFYECTALKEIPEGLFDAFEKVTEISYLFYNCSSLTTIPTSLFDNMKKIGYFGYTFYQCSVLAVESPYTVLNIDGEEVKVHFYDRYLYTDYFTSPVSHSFCFYSCYLLSDYRSGMPSSWRQ